MTVDHEFPVLLQYILDTRLEEVWVDFVMTLVADDSYPPNPFPRFITCLRQAATKYVCVKPPVSLTV